MKKTTLTTLINSIIILSCLSLSSCSSNNKETFTKGIGIYPGEASENFSPEITTDKDSYRNIALNRAAYASTSYDYNLTAQLITDGIITKKLPYYTNLKCNNETVVKNHKEYIFDGNHITGESINGRELSYQLDTYNKNITADQFKVVGRLNYDSSSQKKASGTISGSLDGKNWVTLAKFSQRTFDQQLSAWTLSHKFDVTCSARKAVSYPHYRLTVKGNAKSIQINRWDFLNEGKIIDINPSGNFSSSWMSEGYKKEWVYVDLGTVSKFDNLKLFWINKPEKIEIQTSNDAKKWNTIKTIEDDSQFSNIMFDSKQESRYVKVLMSSNSSKKPFILSEMQVYGNGGTVALAHPQASISGQELSLNGGDWKLARASEVKTNGMSISKADYNASKWIVATVPGTVLTSYYNIGAIPDPNFGDNQLQISESFFKSDFWYRKVFSVPENYKGSELFLNFDGINWKANIFVNGKEIGNINGAFKHKSYDVSKSLILGKENVLAVKIIRNANPGVVKVQTIETPDFNGGALGHDNPTFHASIGWDWIPTIRGRNIGIWNDVNISAKAQKIAIAEPYVITDLNLPDTSSATIKIQTVVNNYNDHEVTGTLKGKYGNIPFSQDVTIAANSSKTVNIAPIAIKNPKLWWPVGYGAPSLYDVEIGYYIDHSIADKISFKSGIREMSYKYIDGALTMYINGKRFIGRGGNWGFSESNLNYRGREYDIAVAYHADMHFNMIRNWVGQIGDKEFYEACDKYGVMVWQDFWLANPLDGPNPDDNDMFIDNADNMIKRIRNHPSIAIYVGRNEGDPLKALDDRLRRLVKKDHPEIFYISNSAFNGVSGGGPYRALTPRDYFSITDRSNLFHSERGMPNLMSYESFTRSLPEKAWWPHNSQWGLHDFTYGGAQSGKTFEALMDKGFGKSDNLKRYNEIAQWINYNGYRAIFESRSNNRKGMLLWMSHPCWPSNVWQTYDYYFDANGGYFGSKKGAEPLHVQWNPVDDAVELVNLSCGDLKDLTVEAKIVNLDGSLAWTKEVKLDSNEDSTNKCFKLDFSEKLSATHFIKLALLDSKGKLLDDNFYWRGSEENNFQALNSMKKAILDNKTVINRDGSQWVIKTTLKNTSSIPALMIHLQVKGSESGELILPTFFNDNYISLLGGEEKTITMRFKQEDTRGERPQVMVSGFNI